ncbi:MAG: hypothetical protein HUU54_04415 [Ignavibacteriaceae bacterium]|nr:hypothetical protein [Ignavibacteriaceae bacterium]
MNTKFYRVPLSAVSAFIVILLVFAPGCGSVFSDFSDKKSPLETEIESVKKKANFDVTNVKVMRNPSEWRGRTISLSGSVVLQPILGEINDVFELRGTNDGFTINFIVHLDHPLPNQTNIGESIRTVSPGKEVRVFGILRGVEAYIGESGYRRELPVMDCLLIYDRNDFYLNRPLWISKDFERRASRKTQ